MKTRILIVSEGSPGHVSQSEGLVRMLGERIEVEATRIETRHRFGGLVRKGVMAWMGRRGRRLPDGFLRRFLGCDPKGLAKPDLILTSGGKAVFAARSLALRLQAPLVFIGERKPYPSEWFDQVLTPSPMETDANDRAIELIPTAIHPPVVTRAAEAWTDKPDGRLWTMVIGGSSKSHHYHAGDWIALGEAMTTLASRHGIRWLVTSSRRTGREVEEMLKSTVDAQAIAEAVWWAEEPRKCMTRYLGACERVFVTQDSVTMVTECLSSGKPTTAVHPNDVRFPDGSFLDAYYARLADHHRIVRLPIGGLASADVDTWDILPCTGDDIRRPADLVIHRFFDPLPT